MKRLAALLYRFSLRTTIPVAIVLFAAAVALFIYQYTKITGDRDVEQEVSGELVQDMTSLQGTLNRLLVQNDTTTAENELLNRGAETNFQFAILLDEKGRAVSSTHIAETGRSLNESAPNLDQALMAKARETMSGVIRISPDRQSVSGYFPVTFGSKNAELRPSRIGILYAQYNLAFQKSLRHNRAYHRMLIMLMSMGGVSLLLWMFFNFSLSRRVTRLVRSVEQFASGKLETRAGLHGRDEIAVLGQAFDRMAEDVSNSAEKIRDLNRIYAVLSNVNKLIIRATDQQRLFEGICRIAVEDGGFAMAWVGLIDTGTKSAKPVAVYGRDEGFLEGAMRKTPEGMGPIYDAVMSGRHFICGNLADESCAIPWRDEALKHGYRSTAVFPVKPRDATEAMITFCSDSPGFFDDEEIRLLDELASDTSFSLWTLEQEKIKEKAEEEREEAWLRELAAMDALRKSEDSLARAQQIAHIGNWDLDLETSRLYWSDEIYRIFEVDPDRFGASYEAFLDAVHPEDRELVDRAYVESVRNKTPYDIVHRLLMKDGRTKYVNEHCETSYDEDGSPLRSIGTVQDITARRLAEEMVRQSEQKFRTIFDEATDGILLADLENMSFHDGNKTICEMLGYSLEEIKTLCVRDIHPEESLSYVTAQFERQLRKEISLAQDMPVKRKDGSVFFADVNSTPIVLDGKTYMMGIFRDITERKRTEELRSRLAAIVEYSEDAIIGKDLDGVITSWNKGAGKIYGYTAEEAVGQSVNVIIPADRIDEATHLLEALRRGEGIEHQETVRVTKGGRQIYVSLSTSPIRDAAGNITGASTIARDVTARKQAEEAIRVAGVYNRSLIESTLDPLVTIGADGKITDVNTATESVTGCDRHELIGTDFSEYFTNPGKAEAGYRQVFKEGMVRDYALELRHKDGHITPVLYNATVYRDEKGEVIGVFAAARDITEQKRAEMERAQYFELFKASSDLMAIADPSGAFLKVNPSCVQTLGYSEEELVSRPFVDFVHPDDRQPTIDEITRQLQRGYSVNFENRYVCKDGSLRWLSWRATYNKAEGITYATARDITDSKRAEEELKQLSQKNELILNSAGDGIYGVDVKGIITFINPAAAKMLGWEPGELVGRHTHETWHSIRPDGSAYPPDECPVMNALNRGIVQRTTEEVFLRKDGSAFPVEYTSTPMWEDSRLVGAVVTFKDITDRKQAEDSIKSEIAVTGALLEAANITSRNLVWEDVIGNVAGLVNELTSGKGVIIFQIANGGILLPLSSAGLSSDSLKYFYTLRAKVEDVSSFNDVVTSKATLLLGRDELEEFGLSGYSEKMGILDLLLTPVISREEVVAVLGVNFDRLPSDQRVVKIIEGIVRQLGVAYDNSHLYMETQNKSIELARSLETLKVLSEIDKRILSTLDRDEMMGGAISQIRRVAPADVAGVILLDESASSLRFCYGWCLNIKIGDVINYDQCAGFQTLKSGKTLVRKNLTEEIILTDMDKSLLDGGIRSDIFVPIIAKGKGVGLLHIGSYRVAGFTSDDIRTIENLSNQLGIALENSRLLSDLEEMFISVVTALASAIDAKSPWTKGHSERVTRYALMIAEKMGLSQQEKEQLRLAGLLHDVGKIGTYDVILDKPGGLSVDEFTLVKKHPEAGANILKPIRQFRDIIPIILHHHERWDGGGYPAGLKGEDIPFLARILCVADSFDSMTADRPYRPSPGIDYAIEEFRRCSGSQFDPKTVEVFVGILEESKKAA